MDTLLLSRLQFAANISFHILFPTINIALCWFLVYFRLRHSAAKGTPAAQDWEEAYYLWTKIFALTFALGVVTGITMSSQFGTNWPGFMEKAGNIAGPLLGYEVITAFFLEASFLGIMLFGRGRVSERVHLIATFLVALGTTFSASGSSASIRGCRLPRAPRSSMASSCRSTGSPSSSTPRSPTGSRTSCWPP